MMPELRARALLRGGGDLASGVAARLHRVGFQLLVTEIEQPLAVRRLVALAEAVYADRVEVEELVGARIEQVEEAPTAWERGEIPVLVDPQARALDSLQFDALIDARMRKRSPEGGTDSVPFVVGLGPGFTAGEHCHAVVETNRGHHMGRVIWRGRAQADTGVPEPVRGYDVDRVLRAPVDGKLVGRVSLAARVAEGETIAEIDGVPLAAPFDGVLRGLLHDGLRVQDGVKVGDLDPRGDPRYCYEISDKALAVGGGVLEALLSRPEIRRRLAG